MNHLFKNNVFRMVIFSLALFVSTKDLGVSLMIALAFLVSMITLRKYSLMEVAEVVEEKQLEDSEELLNETELDITNTLEPENNRRNNKVLFYNNGQTDYNNDTTTLDRHIYEQDDEAPGFLNNVDNNGIKETSGTNEIIEHETERRRSVDNKEDYERILDKEAEFELSKTFEEDETLQEKKKTITKNLDVKVVKTIHEVLKYALVKNDLKFNKI